MRVREMESNLEHGQMQQNVSKSNTSTLELAQGRISVADETPHQCSNASTTLCLLYEESVSKAYASSDVNGKERVGPHL